MSFILHKQVMKKTAQGTKRAVFTHRLQPVARIARHEPTISSLRTCILIILINEDIHKLLYNYPSGSWMLPL